jgi:hypothetical protein
MENDNQIRSKYKKERWTLLHGISILLIKILMRGFNDEDFENKDFENRLQEENISIFIEEFLMNLFSENETFLQNSFNYFINLSKENKKKVLEGWSDDKLCKSAVSNIGQLDKEIGFIIKYLFDYIKDRMMKDINIVSNKCINTEINEELEEISIEKEKRSKSLNNLKILFQNYMNYLFEDIKNNKYELINVYYKYIKYNDKEFLYLNNEDLSKYEKKMQEVYKSIIIVDSSIKNSYNDEKYDIIKFLLEKIPEYSEFNYKENSEYEKNHLYFLSLLNKDNESAIKINEEVFNNVIGFDENVYTKIFLKKDCINQNDIINFLVAVNEYSSLKRVSSIDNINLENEVKDIEKSIEEISSNKNIDEIEEDIEQKKKELNFDKESFYGFFINAIRDSFLQLINDKKGEAEISKKIKIENINILQLFYLKQVDIEALNNMNKKNGALYIFKDTYKDLKYKQVLEDLNLDCILNEEIKDVQKSNKTIGDQEFENSIKTIFVSFVNDMKGYSNYFFIIKELEKNELKKEDDKELLYENQKIIKDNKDNIILDKDPKWVDYVNSFLASQHKEDSEDTIIKFKLNMHSFIAAPLIASEFKDALLNRIKKRGGGIFFNLTSVKNYYKNINVISEEDLLKIKIKNNDHICKMIEIVKEYKNLDESITNFDDLRKLINCKKFKVTIGNDVVLSLIEKLMCLRDHYKILDKCFDHQDTAYQIEEGLFWKSKVWYNFGNMPCEWLRNCDESSSLFIVKTHKAFVYGLMKNLEEDVKMPIELFKKTLYSRENYYRSILKSLYIGIQSTTGLKDFFAQGINNILEQIEKRNEEEGFISSFAKMLMPSKTKLDISEI